MCCSQKPQKSQFPLWLHYPLSWCPQMEKYPGFAVYQLFVSLWEKPQNLLGRERGGHTWEGLKLSPQKERNCKTEGLDLGIPSPNCCSPVQLSRLSRAEKTRKKVLRCSWRWNEEFPEHRGRFFDKKMKVLDVLCQSQHSWAGRKGRGAQGRWGFVLPSLFPPLFPHSFPPPLHFPPATVPQHRELI